MHSYSDKYSSEPLDKLVDRIVGYLVEAGAMEKGYYDLEFWNDNGTLVESQIEIA